MCEPATLTAIAAYTTIAGTALAAYSTYDSARTQKQVAEHNGLVSRLQADDARRRGEEARTTARQKGSVLQGSQRASLAARGLDMTEGTPSDILGQSDFFTQADEALARTNGRREAWAHEAQARNFDAQADGINPGLSMAATLLGGSGQVADRWYAYKRNQSPAYAGNMTGFFGGHGRSGD